MIVLSIYAAWRRPWNIPGVNQVARQNVPKRGRPSTAEVEATLARALAAHQAGRLDEAESLYRALLAVDKKHVRVLQMLGLLAAQRGRFADAEQTLRDALRLKPNEAGWQFNYANVLLALQRFDDAFAAFGRALALNPALADAQLNRGNILMMRKRWEEALACFDAAIKVNPNDARAHCNRALALEAQERFDEALASCDRAVTLDAGSAEFHATRANVLHRMGRNEQALDEILAALSRQSNNASFHYNHGNILFGLRHFDLAFAAFTKAQTLDPGLSAAHYNEGFCRLLLGETERGWIKHEYRFEVPEHLNKRRDFNQPVWRGDQSIEGRTILVHAEQGLGDTILASRYMPIVAALGARVIFEVQPTLMHLMEGLEGVSNLVPCGSSLPPFDIHCPTMSLPLAFKTTLATIPTKIPYLKIPRDKVEEWRKKLDGNPYKVGIAWAGNPNFRRDRDRSITLRNMLPILAVAGIQYFSLQKDQRPGDEELLKAYPQIRDLRPELNDFQDTAAAIASLDLIISSDTSVVNLAGALGRPVWVLLSFNPDWRWMLDGTHSPWYPSARLFRQRRSGDWKSVTDEVSAALTDLISPGKV